MSGIVLFSGGSALAALAAEFSARNENPVWIITTFDSGGSTKAIRRIFDMPAVGDLRNRLLAAANPARASPVILKFLRTRVAAGLAGVEAGRYLQALVASQEWRAAPEAAVIAEDLESFFAAAPSEFDAARASIGNIALTGAWLRAGRSIGAAIGEYEKLLALDARIVPVVEQSLHMAAELESGQVVLGQHRIAMLSPLRIRRIFLTRSAPWQSGPVTEERPQACAAALAALREADLICFPIGSFYTSLLANLLPQGIGEAVATSGARKVYIPNIGYDPESAFLDLGSQIRELLALLHLDAPGADRERFLDTVLLDSSHPRCTPGTCGCLEGLTIVQKEIAQSRDRHDPVSLREAIMAIACGRS